MTEQEAKGFIQGKLDCMNSCEVFDCKGTDECDNCNYCYAQGNFGEQKKAFEMGINALEKQIAKKPIFDDEQSFIRRYHCPECKCVVDAQRYCHHCGQKLDFGEE